MSRGGALVSLSLHHFIYLIVVVSVTVIFAFQLYISTVQVERLLSEKQREVARTVIDRALERFTNKVLLHEQVMTQLQQQISHQQPENYNEIAALLQATYAAFPPIRSVFWGQSDGTLIGFSYFNNTPALMEVAEDNSASTINFWALDDNLQKTDRLLISRDNFITSERDWYQAAISQQGMIWSDVFYYHVSKIQALPLSVPIKDADGRVLGVLGMNLFIDEMAEYLLPEASGSTMFLALNDTSGNVFTDHPAKFDALFSSKEAAALDDIARKTSVWGTLPIEGSVHLYKQSGFSLLANGLYSVTVLMDIDRETASAVLENTKTNIPMLLMIIVCLFALYPVLRRLTRQITPITEAIQSAALLKDTLPEFSKEAGSFEIKEFTHLRQSLTTVFAEAEQYHQDLQSAEQQILMHLRETARLAKIVEITHILVVIIDNDGSIMWANKAFKSQVDVSSASETQNLFTIIGERCSEHNHVDEIQEACAQTSNIKKLTIPLAMGENDLWYNVEIQPVLSSLSGDYQWYCTFSDVTQLKEQEALLRVWKTVHDKAQWGIIVSEGTSLNIGSVNPFITKLTGFQEHELVGVSIQSLMTEALKNSYSRYLRMAERDGVVNYQTDLRKKDGTSVPVWVCVSMVHNDQGEPIYRVASIQDLTAHVELVGKLEQQSKLHVLGQLTSGIVHDFNNILGAITFNNALLALEVENSTTLADMTKQKAHQLSSNIEHSVTAASDLIEQILIFTKKQKHHLLPIDVVALAKETLNILNRKQSVTGNIRCELPDHGIEVNGVKSQLMQIFINLISNAEKAIARHPRKNSEILLTISEMIDPTTQLNMVEISVEDNGDGIDSSDTESIFDAFESFGNEQKSTGIGLALVKRVVELHKGTILLDTSKGEGSCFKVQLPTATQTPSKPNAPSHRPALPNHTEKLHILLIDDDVLVLNSFQRLLTHYGHTVEGVDNGTDGLYEFEQNRQKYDVVITDYVMPNVNGKQVVSEIRRLSESVIVLVTTGYVDEVDIEEFRELGANEVINKPINIQKFNAAIASVKASASRHMDVPSLPGSY